MSLKHKMMTLDMSEITKGMKKLDVLMSMRLTKGLTKAGKKLLSDTGTGISTVPIKRPGYGVLTTRQAGELRASGAVFVDGVKKAGAEGLNTEHATGRYQPQYYGGTPIFIWNREACIVFNAPYAAKQHEKFPVKTEPTAGRYYLSRKLYGNGVEYMEIVAEELKL